MKKIVLMLMAAFFMGGMVMAQHVRRGEKMPDPKVRAERMTERMAKEYSLDDNQKKQLLEANLAFVEKMGNRPVHRRPDMRKGKNVCDSCTCNRAGKHHKKENRVAVRTAYDAQLQKIMTKDQYAAYSKKMQERKNKMESKRKEAAKA